MSRELAADKMNASWYYNWDITPFNYYSFENMEYIPMMWTYGSTEATMIERLKKWDINICWHIMSLILRTRQI